MESFMSSDELRETFINDPDVLMMETKPVFRERNKGRDVSPLIFKVHT